MEADEAGGVARLHLHELLQRVPDLAIAPPMREQEGGHAPVTDRPHVRAGVAQPRERKGMPEHLVHEVQVHRAIVEEREVQERLALLLEESVVDRAQDRLAALQRLGVDARLLGGLVVRVFAELVEPHRDHLDVREELVGQDRDGASVSCERLGLLREHPRLAGWIAHRDHPLRQRQMRDLLVGGEAHEGVEGGVEAQHDPDRTRGDLHAHVEA